MIAILGGGIAGISAGYHLNQKSIEATIYEKRSNWGGLCDNFIVGEGFRFDYFVHLSFTQNEYVKKVFSESSNYISHKPISYNFYKGHWLKHPAIQNLAPLSAKEKTKILTDFIKKEHQNKPQNYKEWLVNQFGEYFTQNFPDIYTKKYWTVPSDELTTDWVGKRISIPNLEEVLKGSYEEQENNFFYASEMRYPEKGGYKSFLNKMATQCNILPNKKAKLIDLQNKKIEFSDNTIVHYESLCSSLPLPELINIIKDCPLEIKEAASKLVATSGQLVSIGFNKPDIAKNLWFYIYDEDILPSRAYSPSLKSPDNAPENCSSLQFETYYSKFTPKKLIDSNLIDHIVEKGVKMNLFTIDDIAITDYKEVKYANVIFDKHLRSARAIVHDYLKKNQILYCGRFGEWGYLWSDQSFLSGKRVADEL